MLAHRLGLVPVASKHLGGLLSRHECACEGTLCNRCSVELSLDVTCQHPKKDVTSRDILSMDGSAAPVAGTPEDPGILIAVLTQGQRLSLRMLAATGTGREHAKWIPCTPSGWEYEAPSCGPDGPTTVTLTLELNGTRSGEDIISNACCILREKLRRIHLKLCDSSSQQ